MPRNYGHPGRQLVKSAGTGAGGQGHCILPVHSDAELVLAASVVVSTAMIVQVSMGSFGEVL